jgi:hypothetical protein
VEREARGAGGTEQHLELHTLAGLAQLKRREIHGRHSKAAPSEQSRVTTGAATVTLKCRAPDLAFRLSHSLELMSATTAAT